MNLPMLEWALFTLFWTWVGAAAAGRLWHDRGLDLARATALWVSRAQIVHDDPGRQLGAVNDALGGVQGGVQGSVQGGVITGLAPDGSFRVVASQRLEPEAPHMGRPMVVRVSRLESAMLAR